MVGRVYVNCYFNSILFCYFDTPLILLCVMKDSKESLKLTANGLKGKLLNFTGKSGEHWVSIIPSLNVSGYGDSGADAIEDLGYNLKVLCEDLFALTQDQRDAELKKMGWSRNKFFKKQYSSAYVDDNGILQNFDSPGQVQKTILEPENI